MPIVIKVNRTIIRFYKIYFPFEQTYITDNLMTVNDYISS